MLSVRRAIFCLPVLMLLACGGGADAPEVVLGEVGEDGQSFAPLQGDQPLVPGSQGGFHVWVKLRFRGLGPGKWMVERTARRASDDRLVLTTRSQLEIGEAGAEGFYETPDPLPSFMCPTPIGVRVMDSPIRFEVRVLDEEGNVVASDSATATPRCPTGDQAEFCEDICAG